MSDTSLIERFCAGERRALAELITRIDDSGESANILEGLPAPPKAARKIALTGSAGVGKSSLIAALAQHLRQSGIRVAVLACDPSSPRTGGALLGDRVRIDDDPDDEGLYVRSVATRGAFGGISDSAAPIASLLERYGFEVVLVETIGVGQDQVAARSVSDAMVLVLTPQSGDEVQWQKAGVMECADVIAVNKSDLGGAEALAVSVGGVSNLPATAVSAETGAGIDELWKLIERTWNA